MILLVTCAIGEVGARLAGRQPLTPGSLLWSHHDRWGWHHQPNAEERFVKLGFEQVIRINSRGLREREIPYEKPAGVVRVLVIGDSSVAGFEVAEEDRYTRVLEDLLRAQGHAVEVINAGTRGWGTDQSLLFLQDEGLRYQPDIVLYQWIDNDPYDNATIHRPYRRYGKPWFQLAADDRLVLRGVPVPTYPYVSNLRVDEKGEPMELPVGWRKRALLWVRDVFVCHSAFAAWLTELAVAVPALTQPVNEAGSFGDATDRPADMSNTSHVFRVTVAMVREMERLARESGARFGMLTADYGFGRDVREAAGVPDIGDLVRLRDLTPRGAVVHAENDPHWNELGHSLYAQALAGALVGTGWLEAAADGNAGVASRSSEPASPPMDR
ncbi:MAG: hypothetical protein DCC71_18990 [Proteobacteria bacterium]|nr:MAG: hypothetical protein DCC71_18990 [Pseudomonadota bacterium]